MAYKHGSYSQIIPALDNSIPSGVVTLPVYIGIAPVHNLSTPANSVNQPILVNSYEAAVAAFGYSDDWASYPLCEAIYAHFRNTIQAIGPIVLINVLDPTVHVRLKSNTVKFNANHTVSIEAGSGAEVILSSVAITGKVLGTDFSVAYDSATNSVVVTDILAAYGVDVDVTITCNEVTPDTVTASDIVGAITDGVHTGLQCVDLIYQKYNLISNVIAAPGFSQIKSVYDALVAKAQAINSKWHAIAVVDLDSSGTGAKTKSAAIALKESNVYTSEHAKVCWPKAKYATGSKTFWLSTLTVVRMQQTDYAHDNVPYVSPSNKPIMASGLICTDGTLITISESDANDLNAKGITTAIYGGGSWRLWGPHCGNYDYSADVEAGKRFDSDIRMMNWIMDSWQDRYLSSIDMPMSRQDIDTKLNDAQVWLNSLVSEGKLIYAEIEFREDNNPVGELVDGNFVFNVKTTTTPVNKSLTVEIQYTTDGLTTLYGGEI